MAIQKSCKIKPKIITCRKKRHLSSFVGGDDRSGGGCNDCYCDGDSGSVSRNREVVVTVFEFKLYMATVLL